MELDYTSIIVAVLACAGTASGSIYGIKKSTSLIEYRLKQLEGKVDKHNQVVERVFNLEKKNEIISEKLTTMNQRIDGIEKK